MGVVCVCNHVQGFSEIFSSSLLWVQQTASWHPLLRLSAAGWVGTWNAGPLSVPVGAVCQPGRGWGWGCLDGSFNWQWGDFYGKGDDVKHFSCCGGKNNLFFFLSFSLWTASLSAFCQTWQHSLIIIVSCASFSFWTYLCLFEVFYFIFIQRFSLSQEVSLQRDLQILHVKCSYDASAWVSSAKC